MVGDWHFELVEDILFESTDCQEMNLVVAGSAAHFGLTADMVLVAHNVIVGRNLAGRSLAADTDPVDYRRIDFDSCFAVGVGVVVGSPADSLVADTAPAAATHMMVEHRMVADNHIVAGYLFGPVDCCCSNRLTPWWIQLT